jgi:hypothetical protein
MSEFFHAHPTLMNPEFGTARFSANPEKPALCAKIGVTRNGKYSIIIALKTPNFWADFKSWH